MKVLFYLILTSSLLSVEKFHNDISKSEKRIKEYKNEAKGLEINLPEQLKLFFKELKADYAIFYDWNGEEVYYRYRRNKFDFESEKKTIGLFQGQSYRIKGIFMGIASFKDLDTKLMLHSPQFYLKPDPENFWSFDRIESFDLVKEENLKDKHSILIFKLISFETTAIDELIY